MKRQSGKIKILVIDDAVLDGVGWWRNSEPFTALEKMYGQYLDIEHGGENVDFRKVKMADVVVRFRPNSQKSLEFLQVCKAVGTKIILDIDDNLWKIPPGHPIFLDSLGWGETLHEIYDLADVVWTSTDELKYQVGDLGRCETMPNAIHPYELPDDPAKWTGSAMWRGNDKQVGDLYRPEIVEWFSSNADKYDWTFAGYVPDYPFSGNVRFQKRLQPLAYFLGLKSNRANIMWKPLTANPFNDAKSNIAWIEATMAGGVCVTNYAGKAGWECALPEFTTDYDEIVAVWEKSKDRILTNYNLETITEKRFQSILDLVK